MQRKECTCASIELAKKRVSSRMVTTEKITHGSEIRRGKSLGLFTRSSVVGTLMRAIFFIVAIPILASAQTGEQIAATQAQIAARQAQKKADLAISQRDALQPRLEDATLAANQRDSLQNQPKTGEAGTNPSQQDVFSAADRFSRSRNRNQQRPRPCQRPFPQKRRQRTNRPRRRIRRTVRHQNQRDPKESTGHGRQRRKTPPPRLTRWPL